jgi:hypothetical protein
LKIAILFNCQHTGLANAMRALRPDLQIQSFELFLYRSPEGKQQLLAQLERFNTVLGPGLGPDWGALSTESLRARGYKYFLLPGIAFSGYHPDTVYVFATPTNHFRAATGPYHSRIAIAGFLAGLSVEETVGLFNRLVFSRLGYLDAFQQSRLFLINQFKNIGVDLAPYIDAWAAKGCFMHTINHPKIRVLCDLAVIACQLIGLAIPGDRAPLEMVADNLALYPEMPVYPEIAYHLGIKGHTMFRAVDVGHVFQFFPLESYLRSCFKFYETGPRNEMLKADGVKDAMEKLGLQLKNVEGRTNA